MIKSLGFFAGALRFHLNKLAYKAPLANVKDDALLHQATSAFEYYTSSDEQGILRGGEYPWQYLQNLVPQVLGSAPQKLDYLRRELARLPSNVAFSFACSPDLQDADIIKAAFRKAGFTHLEKRTHLFKPSAGQEDILMSIKPDMRNKIRAAMRDLELVPMSADEFFTFYEDNLSSVGKKYYFNFGIDKDLAKKALSQTPAQAHIVAVRQKGVDQTARMPFDAAILCTGCADGFLKLSRITYRVHKDSDKDINIPPPHKHAIKFLVYEAMKMAADMGATLDTDGYTPGGEVLYSRFGVLEAKTRDEYKRKTIYIPIKRGISLIRHHVISPLRRITYSSFFKAPWRKTASEALLGP